jgi:hypothetical protein
MASVCESFMKRTETVASIFVEELISFGTTRSLFYTGATHTFEHISTFRAPTTRHPPVTPSACSKTLSNADDRCSLLADATVL